jgi:hypothetical protein
VPRAPVEPQQQSEQRPTGQQQLDHQVRACLACDLHELFHAAMLDQQNCRAISAALRLKPHASGIPY